MPDPIRLGIIGASPTVGWAHRSHLPAIVASPEFELTGVCTTRKETAEEAKRIYGAKMAFYDYHEMLANPDIDAVAVVLRVPTHYQITKDALNAGKHVFTEGPLGKDTSEAKELANLARAKGLKAIVGLQARANPAMIHMKELVEGGYVGEIISCNMKLMRGGVLERVSGRTWQRDVTLGANTLTIATGHSIDAMRFVAGDFSQVSSVITTQVKQWHESDTQKMVDVTSPDNIVISGVLANGAVASAHVGSIPWAGTGYIMEIYGRTGTLVATSEDSPQLGDVRLQGAQNGDTLEDIEIPARHTNVLEGMPHAEPFNVGQLYYMFGQGINGSRPAYPDFDTAVELHQFIDAMRESAKEGQATAVKTV